MMKTIILKNVTISGFKGYKDICFYEFNKGENILAGGNGKGKTSVADAVNWAFTGKLFEGNKDEIVALNNCSTTAEVKVVFENEDGENVLVRRLSKTSSAKVRLNNKAITQKKLNEFVDENTFMMIFNPLNFLAKKPTEARNLIMSLVKDVVTDDMVLNVISESNRERLEELDLSKDNLKEIRKNISLLEEKLSLKNSLKMNYEKDLESNSILIKGFDNLDITKLLEELESKNENFKDMNEEMVSLQSSYNSKSNELVNLLSEMSQISNNNLKTISDDILKLKEEEQSLIIQGKEMKAKEYSPKNYFELEKAIHETKLEVDRITKENDIYRNAIKEINNKHNIKPGSICPVCQRAIDEKIANAIKITGSKEAQPFIEKGVRNKSIIDKLSLQVSELLEQIETAKKQESLEKKSFYEKKESILQELREKVSIVKNKKAKLEEEKIQLEKEVEVKLYKYNVKKNKLQKAIEDIKTSMDSKNSDISKIKNIIESLNMKIKDNENNIKKLELLKEKESNLKNDILGLDKEIEKLDLSVRNNRFTLMALMDFSETKIKLIEKEISSKLNKVSFKIEKLNRETAEIKSCFNILYDNKILTCCSLSERIKAGIEISSMLEKSLGVNYPMFVDNSESVLEVEVGEKQVIRTIVVDTKDVVKINKDTLESILITTSDIVKKSLS